MKEIRGTGVALVTPFTSTKAVDYNALARLVDHTIDGGVNYLVALGTTAETATLNKEEKQKVLSFIVKQCNGRVPVVVGIGGNNTLVLAEEMNSYDLTGVCAILSVTPYYNKPNQKGLYEHFSYIAKYSPLPVILYNVPGRTGCNMSASTTVKLATDFPDIFVAVKEASGDMGQISYILKNAPEEFMVISGDDNLTVPMISIGAQGVISVSANAVPRDVSRCIECALEGDYNQSRSYLYRLLEFQDAIFDEGNPVGIKSALAYKGIIQNELRLPLICSSLELDENIERIIKENSL